MSAKRKEIALGVPARTRLVAGADFLADSVQPTLGPYGTNFILEKGEKLTNDGRNIAAEIECEDVISQKGLFQLRKAAIDTEQEVKDASTTTIILGRAILHEAIKNLPNETVAIGNMSTSEVMQQIEKECAEVCEKLDKMSVPVGSMEELIEVATVSTQDDKLGEIIGTLQWEIGPLGVIVAEDTLDKECTAELVKGVLIDNGLSATFVINNEEKQCLETSGSHFILTTNVVKDLTVLNPLILQLGKMGAKQLVIMARAFTEEAVKQCGEYQKKGFPILPVNAPYVDQRNVMLDLEAVLGGKFIDVEVGSLESILPSDVGYVERMVVERYRAIYTGKDDEKSQERVAKRIKELEDKASGKVSVFEKENLEKRIAMLKTGFAIVSIGAQTEIQRKRLKDKADDAVGTVRMALQEGVVKGGGQAYKDISDSLPDTYILKVPLRTIYEQIMHSAPKDFVIAEWVKDPVKTLKTALRFACEVGANLATAAGASASKREEPRLVKEVKNDEE